VWLKRRHVTPRAVRTNLEPSPLCIISGLYQNTDGSDLFTAKFVEQQSNKMKANQRAASTVNGPLHTRRVRSLLKVISPFVSLSHSLSLSLTRLSPSLYWVSRALGAVKDDADRVNTVLISMAF